VILFLIKGMNADNTHSNEIKVSDPPLDIPLSEMPLSEMPPSEMPLSEMPPPGKPPCEMTPSEQVVALQQSSLPPNIQRIPILADLIQQPTDNHETNVPDPPASSTGGEEDSERSISVDASASTVIAEAGNFSQIYPNNDSTNGLQDSDSDSESEDAYRRRIQQETAKEEEFIHQQRINHFKP
jgi:hypothetical protein